MICVTRRNAAANERAVRDGVGMSGAGGMTEGRDTVLFTEQPLLKNQRRKKLRGPRRFGGSAEIHGTVKLLFCHQVPKSSTDAVDAGHTPWHQLLQDWMVVTGFPRRFGTMSRDVAVQKPS